MFGEGGAVAGGDCVGFCCGAELFVGEDGHGEMGLLDFVVDNLVGHQL